MPRAQPVTGALYFDGKQWTKCFHLMTRSKLHQNKERLYIRAEPDVITVPTKIKLLRHHLDVAIIPLFLSDIPESTSSISLQRTTFTSVVSSVEPSQLSGPNQKPHPPAIPI